MRLLDLRHYHSPVFNASAKLFVVGHRKGSLSQSLFTSLIPLQTADVGTVACGYDGGQCPPYNYKPRDGTWGSITSRQDWRGGWL